MAVCGNKNSFLKATNNSDCKGIFKKNRSKQHPTHPPTTFALPFLQSFRWVMCVPVRWLFDSEHAVPPKPPVRVMTYRFSLLVNAIARLLSPFTVFITMTALY